MYEGSAFKQDIGWFKVGTRWKNLNVCFVLFQSIFRPNNMIAQSQSGTGKTAAFVLSMLSRVDATKNLTQVRNI